MTIPASTFSGHVGVSGRAENLKLWYREIRASCASSIANLKNMSGAIRFKKSGSSIQKRMMQGYWPLQI